MGQVVESDRSQFEHVMVDTPAGDGQQPLSGGMGVPAGAGYYLKSSPNRTLSLQEVRSAPCPAAWPRCAPKSSGIH